MEHIALAPFTPTTWLGFTTLAFLVVGVLLAFIADDINNRDAGVVLAVIGIILGICWVAGGFTERPTDRYPKIAVAIEERYGLGINKDNVSELLYPHDKPIGPQQYGTTEASYKGDDGVVRTVEVTLAWDGDRYLLQSKVNGKLVETPKR